MTFFDAIFLGILQGVAEFLPISSSGHLTLAQFMLGLEEPPLTLNLSLHLATLIVVILAFRSRILGILFPLNYGYLKALIICSLPTAVIGLFIKKVLGEVFSNPLWPSLLLCLNGIFLLFLYRTHSRSTSSEKAEKQQDHPSLRQALLIGIAQGLAALPGISRSGSTIGTARLLGIAPGLAAEFSLLASVPVILGALLLEGREFSGLEHPQMVLVSSVIAGIAGWFSVKILLNIVKKGAFRIWGVYCIFAGLLFLTWHSFLK